MRRAQPFLVLLIFALLAGVLITLNVRSRRKPEARFDSPALPFQLEDVIIARIPAKLPFFVADVDHDGNDDLLINDWTRLLWYRLHGKEMSPAGTGVYEHKGSTRMVADANGDARPEFFLLTGMPEGSMVSCHDWFSPRGPSEPLYTIGPLFPPRGSGVLWIRFNFFGSFTAEKGAHPEIFIGLNSKSDDRSPRSLLAYDGVTGRELWHFDFGPPSWDLKCGDFGANGPRVLLSTNAVANGISCNGWADSVSYVFCLDARNGRSLWEKPVAGFAGRSNLAIADINGDGQNEILVARCLGAKDPHLLDDIPPWTVAALSSDGAVLDSVPLPIRATSICAAKLDSDPYPEILVQGFDGTFFILNHDLMKRKVIPASAHTNPAKAQIFGVRDLNDDGKPEIICRQDNILIIRDNEGTPIAERKFADQTSDQSEAQLARYDGRNYVVAASGDLIHVMALKRATAVTRLAAHLRSSTTAVAVIVTLLACAAALFVFGRLLRRGGDQLVVDEARDDLLTAMSAFGHGGSSLKIIDRIRLHLKNWERAGSDTAARDELFANLHTTFMKTVVPELKHIVMLARKARVTEEIWGTVIARSGSAGREMEAISASGREGPGAGREQRVASALAALNDVDESVARIRSHLRSVFRTPVAEALERGVARFRYDHGAIMISLALASDVTEADGVFISPVAFDKILESLLSNAARATEGTAAPEIAIKVQWEGDYCRIDIRDNGCGIPHEDWEHVFERHFTTKAEGGFGLYYAREELARFGGKIFVLESAAGSGTTMRVVLRKS
jgi:signal transduction histidine kinase